MLSLLLASSLAWADPLSDPETSYTGASILEDDTGIDQEESVEEPSESSDSVNTEISGPVKSGCTTAGVRAAGVLVTFFALVGILNRRRT